MLETQFLKFTSIFLENFILFSSYIVTLYCTARELVFLWNLNKCCFVMDFFKTIKEVKETFYIHGILRLMLSLRLSVISYKMSILQPGRLLQPPF